MTPVIALKGGGGDQGTIEPIAGVGGGGVHSNRGTLSPRTPGFQPEAVSGQTCGLYFFIMRVFIVAWKSSCI